MEKNTKIFIGIGSGLIAALGVFLAITKPWKKKEEEIIETKAEIAAAPSPNAGKPTHPVTIKKTTPKKPVFESPAINAPGKIPVGKNAKGIWVYAAMDGVKVYKKSTIKGTVLGNLYNTYKSGKIIGKFSGSTSVAGEKYLIVSDAGTQLVVNENLVYTKTI